MTNNTPEAIWDKIQKGVFVIAEAGKNFIQTEEDRPIAEYLENARRLVDEAVKGKADAIKFQTHTVEDEVMDIDFTSTTTYKYAAYSRNLQKSNLWKCSFEN